MEWRCKWCGKPHEENDPPCDNCGHGRFEKAVVPMGPDSTDDAGQVVWVCTECGREHQKHSPPCSRCGNATLQQREADYSDVETVEETGWLDILDKRYGAGFAVVGVLGLVLALGMVGVVDLPGLGGPPSPPDVAGENESVDGVSLAAAEDAFVATVNAERDRTARLDRGATLDAMATYFNKRRVESGYGDADPPTRSELDPFDPDCGRQASVLGNRLPRGGALVDDGESDLYWNASELGTVLAGGESESESFSDRLSEEGRVERIGVDIHVAPDQDIYVTVVYC